MQIAGRWNVTNITDGPVHVVGVRMVRPNLTGIALVQHAERGAFGRYPVLAGRMAEVATDFWFQPPNRKEGKDLVVRIEFTDNFGNRHKTKKVRFQSRSRVGTTESDVATEPVYQITDPIVRNVVSVLKAEVERYRSCGRSVGGLGSVETHFEGQIMKGVGTEWCEADSPRQQELMAEPVEGTISSDNASALSTVFEECKQPEERAAFLDALILRMSRDSEYAPVGYLIALVLFRLGRLGDGLTKARADLHGDERYGFSDLMRLIDGLLRFEHHLFEDDLLDDIERFLEGIDEDRFRVPQRIAAIRAYRLTPGQPSGHRN